MRHLLSDLSLGLDKGKFCIIQGGVVERFIAPVLKTILYQ